MNIYIHIMDLLLSNNFFINELEIVINRYSHNNLNRKLLLFKMINIFKNYKKNNNIRNLLLLIFLPHEITLQIHKYVPFIKLCDLITSDESDNISFNEIINYKAILLQQPDIKSMESMFYQCRCGSKNVKIREKQLRSLDEPSTIIIICEKCNNTWNSKY